MQSRTTMMVLSAVHEFVEFNMHEVKRFGYGFGDSALTGTREAVYRNEAHSGLSSISLFF